MENNKKNGNHEHQEVSQRWGWLLMKNPNNIMTLVAVIALVIMALGYSLTAIFFFSVVAIYFAWQSRCFQVALVILVPVLLLALSYQQNAFLHEAALTASKAATRKAPGLLITIPGRFVFDSTIVVNGQARSNFEAMRTGRLLAIGENALGWLGSDELEPGEMTIESKAGATPTPILAGPKQGTDEKNNGVQSKKKEVKND